MDRGGGRRHGLCPVRGIRERVLRALLEREAAAVSMDCVPREVRERVLRALLEREAEPRATRLSAAEAEAVSVLVLGLVWSTMSSKKKIITRLRIVAKGAPRKTSRWITLNPPVIAPADATFLESVTLAAPQIDSEVFVLALTSAL